MCYAILMKKIIFYITIAAVLTA
ncbi:MAG: lipoprotein, partial [Xanthomonadales bacterium]|nr:lipoprotein [Xanthomonadales bacterium]